MELEQVPIDFKNVESLIRGFDGVDVLFSVQPMTEDFVPQAKNVIHAAQRAGIRHIVRISVLGADGDDRNRAEYRIAKRHQEAQKLIEDSGVEFTFIQPNSFMQNFLPLAGQLQAEGRFAFPLGHGHVSYVDIRDVASLAVAALTGNGHEGKSYMVTGPEPLSGVSIAEAFSRLLSKKIRYDDIPEEVRAEVPDWFRKDLAELYRINKSGKHAFLSPVDPILIGRMPFTFERFLSDYSTAFGEAERKRETA
jgi:uncharacterized protein YbjT (DUF2867 family)